jgi:hypothetical protein
MQLRFCSALQYLPSGGLFIAGGMAARLMPYMRDERMFLDVACNKGRMSGLVRSTPIMLVTHDNVGMLGAKVVAARLTCNVTRGAFNQRELEPGLANPAFAKKNSGINNTSINSAAVAAAAGADNITGGGAFMNETQARAHWRQWKQLHSKL